MMRAKMRVVSVKKVHDGQEDLVFTAVSKRDGYPEGGNDENNTYAQFTPMADLSMSIQNERLFGKLKEGDEVYLDFTLVE